MLITKLLVELDLLFTYKTNSAVKSIIDFTTIILFFTISGAAFAQEDSLKKNVDVGGFWDGISIAPPPNVIYSIDSAQNPKVSVLYDSSLMAYYDFSIVQFQRSNKVLAWQYTSGRIIFWMVLTIVISGLILSGIQFYLSAKSNFEIPKSEIKLSYDGIRLHTSVLGLLILIISIAFFYMYLKHVYPISTLD